jgi:hypothetical protein
MEEVKGKNDWGHKMNIWENKKYIAQQFIKPTFYVQEKLSLLLNSLFPLCQSNKTSLGTY